MINHDCDRDMENDVQIKNHYNFPTWFLRYEQT